MPNVVASSMTFTPRRTPKDALKYEVGKTYRLIDGYTGGLHLTFHDVNRKFVVSGVDYEGCAWSPNADYQGRKGDWCVGTQRALIAGRIVLVDG